MVERVVELSAQLEMEKPISSKGMVAGLVSLNLWNGISMGILTLAIPLYAASMKATTVQIGIIGAASWIGVLFTSLPTGFLVDRHYDWRAVFVGGAVLSALFVFLFPLVTFPWLLALAVLLRGIPHTASHISVSSTFLKNLAVMGEEKAGWHKASLSIGGSIGPVLGGYGIKEYGFNSLFALVGVLTLMAAVVVYLAGGGRIVRLSPHKIQIGEFITGRRSDFRRLLRNKILVQTSVVEGLATSTLTTFGAFMPVFLLRSLHLPSDFAGITLATQGIAYIVTLLLGGRFLKKLDRKGHYVLGSIVSIGGLLILGGVSTPKMILAGATLLGIGLAVIAFATFTLLSKVDADKGTVFGFYGICLGIFAILGPIATGVVGRILSIQVIFWFLVPLFAAVGALGFLGKERASAINQ